MTEPRPTPTVSPRLIVPSSAEAIDYYVAVFGARELERFAEPSGAIVHAAIEIGGGVISMADERPEWGNLAPASVGGSPVLIHVTVDDPDAVAAAAVDRGGEMIIQIADQFYGKREGRLRDPFGHLWILSKDVEDLSDDEIRRRMKSS